MNRRLALLFAMTSALANLSTVRGADRPDVLVVLCDQWSPRYLSWDNPQVLTPNLDRIAREGMIFDACYTTSPVCMPARVSLITGLYPHDHGHALWGNALDYYASPASAKMFLDIQRAGYTTAQIGKLHWFSSAAWKQEFKSIEDYYRALGLDHVVDVSGPPSAPGERNPYARYLGELGLLEKVAADLHDRYVNWEYEPRASVVGPEHYHDTFVTGAAVDFIRQQPADKPLCLVVSLHSPHPPLDAPGEFATMFDPQKLWLPENVPQSFKRDRREYEPAEVRRMLANYLGKIALVDRNLDRLTEAMQKRGTWDQALFVLTADHGEMMGAHGALTKGRFYEESARVPLVVRWPKQVKPGRTKALAQMFDVYPTIVEAIGGKMTLGRFAKSLLPVATGKQAAVRELAISEIGKSPPLDIMARNARYKWWAQDEQEYLFDLSADPLELHNLADDAEHRDVADRLRRQLLTHLRSTEVNLGEGYKSKVQRLREQAAEAN